MARVARVRLSFSHIHPSPLREPANRGRRDGGGAGRGLEIQEYMSQSSLTVMLRVEPFCDAVERRERGKPPGTVPGRVLAVLPKLASNGAPVSLHSLLKGETNEKERREGEWLNIDRAVQRRDRGM